MSSSSRTKTNLFLAVALTLATSAGHAAELYINLFFGVAPVSGAEVRVDGEWIGDTNSRGNLLREIASGSHQVEIGPEGEPSAIFELSITDGQNADVLVDLSAADRPSVAIDTYMAGDIDTAKTGVVSGQVNNMFGQPVAGAAVAFPQLGLQAITDSAGYFQLPVPRGEHSLSARHPSAGQSSGGSVRVAANVGVNVTLQLRPQDNSATLDGRVIEEVLVLASSYRADAIEAVTMEREALTVVDAIDYQQIARFGDSSVASAVRRVVGVTVRDGKYAIIRGLEGRYVATSLNGALMPSTDPLRRDAELDLFPADILESIEVQKGYTADQLGDATAGSLRINTRGLPQDRIFKVSLSGGYQDGVTGESLLNYEGSETDDLGFDDGFRSLPAALERAAYNSVAPGQNPSFTDLELARLGQSMTNVYNLTSESAVPAFGVSAAFGDRIYLDEADFGYYGAISWDMDTQARQDYSSIDGPAVVAQFGSESRVEKTYDLNAYFVTGIEHDSSELLSKTIFIRQTSDRSVFSTIVDAGDNDRVYEDYVLEWTERQFISQQIEGQSFFGDSRQLNWSVTGAQSSRYQPDRRNYTYDNGLLLTGTLDRVWSDLTDDSLNLDLDWKIDLQLADDISTTLTIGGTANRTERAVELYRIGFNINSESTIEDLWNLPELRVVDPETIFVGDNLTVLDTNNNLAIEIDLGRTEETAHYRSDADRTGLYIQTETNIGYAWTLLAGLRQEDYAQKVSYPLSSTIVVPDLETSELLTALGVNFAPSDNWVFRLGYSNTLSYPGLTERPRSLVYENETNTPIFGNPNLQLSTIDNLDLRAEYYFDDDNSSVSLAFFRKDIDAPIERAREDASGSASDSFTYRNNESAVVQGIELDLNLTIFDGIDWDGFVSGNIARSTSDLTLNADSARLEAVTNRELQGLSPWIANLQFGVDHIETAQSLTLVINYFDDRIDRVVRSSFEKAVVEVGRADVGLNYEKSFMNGSSLSVKIGNLLDSDIEYRSETVSGNQSYSETYRRGRSLSVGYSYEF